ncbi:ATP-binding protein [Spirosoma foliorum]|uniref:ATP-binding protein n=1 Tax=Spirosoma foliorum TaxID=2710596 RepID=A0A7G5H2U4_9BACT|nr:ATP-binding protein [Spirosoma foliorum]QMW05436.1 ATP-binding protein [Spirosoma foliorum]
MKPLNILIEGIPDTVKTTTAAIYRSRLITTVEDLCKSANIKEIKISIGTPSLMQATASSDPHKGESVENDNISVEKRSTQYKAQSPLYNFDFLILPRSVKEDLLTCIDLIKVEAKVFNEWNLKSIEPFPKTALNFYGEPGTGKTLAAHAIASYLGKNIIVASYAQIESKYHGEGPKNVEALFLAAERNNAVLFIDEADSLLSKRLTNVTQGSEQAINSMRSQLLISIGQFKGTVIFATNLIENYDKAFDTRVYNIHFPLPDTEARAQLWTAHLPKELPLSEDVLIQTLAEVDNICGRDIKNAIVNTAVKCALNNVDPITLKDLLNGIARIKQSRTTGFVETLEATEEGELINKLKSHIDSGQAQVNELPNPSSIG